MRTAIPITAVLTLLAPPAAAQFVEPDVTVLYTLLGEAAGDNFGLELVAVGDYDQDGARELLVSAPGNDEGANNAGKAYLFDGASGALIRAHPGTRVGEARRNVCDAGDVDGDGALDYLVGTGDDWVYVYSGATGVELHALSGTAGEQFGFRSCGVGDLNGDGFGDLLVGAWSSDTAGNNAGAAYLLSGADGSLLRQHLGTQANSQFGHTVAMVGDLDDDGVSEYTIGAPGPYGTAQRGEVFVFSGAKGVELAPRLTPKNSGRIFGAWVPSSGGNDLNSDGVPDFTVTDLGDKGNDRGRLYVYDGATRAELYTVSGFSVDSGFGGAPPNPASRLGDLTGDDVGDLLVGSWESKVGANNGGQADILDGVDGSRIRTVTSTQAGSFLGGSAAGLGFVDGDQAPDFALGANGAGNSKGKVFVIAGHGTTTSYCTAGTSASGCAVQLVSSGVPSASTASGYTVTAPGVEGGAVGQFFYGTNGRQSAPWGNGTSVRCVAAPVVRAGLASPGGTNGACDGSVAIDFNALWSAVPNKNPGAGANVHLQFWYRDPNNTSNQTTSLSNALETFVCP